MASIFRTIITLLLAASCWLFWRCERTFDVTKSDQQDLPLIAIEADYRLVIEKALWKDDKKAAYTIAFDDTKPSHYQVAAPELEKRGMVGTFNINPKYVTNWDDWRRLAAAGHEIASHTYSHPNCTQLTEEELRNELQLAKQEILAHVPEISRVPSFTYPYGLSDDHTHQIVGQYHISARCGWGLNDANFPAPGLLLVKGVGVYPPFDMGVINSTLDQTFRNRGWMLAYFHVVSAEGASDKYIIPIQNYLEHLDYVAAVSDSLWIATQGEVADYIRLRRDATVHGSVEDRYTINLSIDNAPDDIPQHIPLTIKISLPKNWLGQHITESGLNKGSVGIIQVTEDHLYINLPIKTVLRLQAVHKGT